MFTPEFVNEEEGAVVLVASHSLETPEARVLSAEFNRARISFGAEHVPSNLKSWRLIYDVRGQNLPESSIEQVHAALVDVCHLEFKR